MSAHISCVAFRTRKCPHAGKFALKKRARLSRSPETTSARFCCRFFAYPHAVSRFCEGKIMPALCMSPDSDICAPSRLPKLFQSPVTYLGGAPSLQWRNRAGLSPASILAFDSPAPCSGSGFPKEHIPFHFSFTILTHSPPPGKLIIFLFVSLCRADFGQPTFFKMCCDTEQIPLAEKTKNCLHFSALWC